ncbi:MULTISPECIES: phosphoenolpyruvate--protein phosphotransferase [unclassified Nocardioides]|uniref:phosphoenolpyruvate--protein phosphotransferase n=1 Tax=unclassified Nocardioides TaxID=2615069 RepID=UPI0009F00C84|nr:MULTISPECIES: phosphoenolpyruvate--protein phosphotransferase [unclassified Nocardioides]GAW49120.1 phosphoenolpyruvate--protein phosphotransferase [Nocardioides sp. PD653-B2]GAW56721.1 phosphoenolpyruvate--protein phosphotransferase [Nocardioides sp. PD653]
MATSSDPTLRGTPVVPGVAFGPASLVRAEVSPAAIARFHATAYADPDAALAAYEDAAQAVADGFVRKAAAVSGAAAQVLTASAGLARDKGLRGAVRKQLRAGDDLLAAVHGAVAQFVTIFSNMGGLMAERVTDLQDIERRVVAHLVGEPEPGVGVPESPCVLVAEDLAPSDTAGLDPRLVLALVTERGGPTSHTAIIARQLGIPCVVGVAGAMTVAGGTPLLVDGVAGTVELGPDEAEASARVTADVEARSALASWAGPGATADGIPVKILANVADADSARAAGAAPVQGVGLFRTELSFLNRKEEPSVEEQAAIYGEVLEAFGDHRYVVVRTLDAGSDKPVAFATHEGEENPALGVRGLRLSFGNPGLMDRQLDAVAAASKQTGTETWVMAPMVATVAEATEFATKVHGRGLKAGVMVEVPSAALLAHRMLEVVDFLSIGTNDLTQYTMAADRMATDLAHLTDPWQPAVLQLVAITAEAGRQAGKPVGVCGEAAADPLLACVLVGMGITSLSMAAAAVRPVGARLASVTMDACEEAAEAALSAADPTAARDAVRALLG